MAKFNEPKEKKERFKTLKQIGQTYKITRQTDKALPLILLLSFRSEEHTSELQSH